LWLAGIPSRFRGKIAVGLAFPNPAGIAAMWQSGSAASEDDEGNRGPLFAKYDDIDAGTNV
jgi:hypothetical protein